MIRASFSALFLSLLFAAAAAAQDAPWTGSFDLYVGQRHLDQEQWRPVESQQSFGLDVAFGRSTWPAHILLGVNLSTDDSSADGVKVEGNILEWSAGVASAFPSFGGLTPMVGGGVSFITAELRGSPSTSNEASDKDSFRPGYFITGGLTYRLLDVFNIGGRARYVGGTDITLFGVKGNANHINYALVFGWSW